MRCGWRLAASVPLGRFAASAIPSPSVASLSSAPRRTQPWGTAARGVFMGLEANRNTALPVTERKLCEIATGGGALTVDDWLAVADAVLAGAASLPIGDALLVLRALERHNIEDPSLYAELDRRLSVVAQRMSLDDVLQALELVGRRQARGARKNAPSSLTRTLVERLHELGSADPPSLLCTLTTLARGGGATVALGIDTDATGESPLLMLVRRLAASVVELPGLTFLELVSAGLAFEALGVLHGPLKELLEHRRALILDTAPLLELFRALVHVESRSLPTWLLRSADAEATLLVAFVERLEAAGDDAAGSLGDDAFACLALLQRRRRVPSSFLRSLCVWARRALRRNSRSSVSAQQLTLLDDACEARKLRGASREALDAAIRAFVVFGPTPQYSATTA